MDLNDQKEHLSLAYIRAVAARAGFHVQRPEIDKTSVDGEINCDDGVCPKIAFQAKATSRDILEAEWVVIDLPIKNYNDLRKTTAVPRFLIVLVLDVDDTQWLSQSEDDLTMRRCAYWTTLQGEPEAPNKTSIRIRLPRKNVFDVTALQDLMRKVEESLRGPSS